MKKKVIAFGTGLRCINILKCYIRDESNYDIIAFSDSNPDKWGKNLSNIPIISPKDINHTDCEEILVFSTFYNEIKRSLIEKYKLKNVYIRKIDSVYFFLDERIRKKYSEYLVDNKMCEDPEMYEIMDYLKTNSAQMYNYSFANEYKNQKMDIEYDVNNQLFYVYEKKDRIYFAKWLDTIEKVKEYYNFMCMEQDINSPHRYESNSFKVEEGEVGIDIGCADGNFALSVIDKVKHIYLIESDPAWVDAIKLTFEPYKEKVTIIKAEVSNEDRGEIISLDSIFRDENIDFIKLDIEGAELKALEGAKSLLAKKVSKIAVAVYHEKEHNEVITKILHDNNFCCYNTRGYVLCLTECALKDPDLDFRKALLLGDKNESSDIVNMYSEL